MDLGIDRIINMLVQGVLLGGLYVLYGTGLSLIFGVMRLVNLAHGDFIVLSAYISLILAGFGVNPLISIVIVVPVMFVLGLPLQRFVLNRTLGKGIMPPLLITFGLSVIIQNALQLGFSADTQGLDAGALETASITITPSLSIGLMPLLTFVIAIAVLIGLQVFFRRTRLGRAFRATSDDPEAAEMMGINSRHVYALAMGLSLAIVAIAGILLGVRTNFAPALGPARLLLAFETVIIGGLGSIWGTLAGGIILGLAQTIGAQINPAYFQLSGHLVTLLVLVFRPTGLFAVTRDK
ncbi:MAG: branched-chain amino acid ABC transporter permease [Pleurocapsa minor GSE-CHR-MK-17-07R]|jgi:branched-chain amino acid transport system permease protein|nr:branched-chain amino acid ABC transporter permease [Pleurocapsa minor GSE-CHR-MK 17-07R]